jgi:predicted  nucleic acid-binding Zn-ribbon protein
VIKIVDKRCSQCEKVYYDVIDDDMSVCTACGGQLQRMYSMHKEVQMLPHWCEHMAHEPVFIHDRQHFKKELKKRGLDEVPLKKPKGTLYFT